MVPPPSPPTSPKGEADAALLYASSAGDLADVRSLLAADMDDGEEMETDPIDGDGCTPLMRASLQGHLSVVQALLSGKADPHAQDSDGFTALIFACFRSHEAVARLLASEGMLEIRDSTGRTALSWAAQQGHSGTVHALLEFGACTDASSDKKQTPLLFAESHGHTEVSKLLRKTAMSRGPA